MAGRGLGIYSAISVPGLEHDYTVDGFAGVYISGGFLGFLFRSFGGFIGVGVCTRIQAFIGITYFVFLGSEGGSRGRCKRGQQGLGQLAEIGMRRTRIGDRCGYGVFWPDDWRIRE